MRGIHATNVMGAPTAGKLESLGGQLAAGSYTVRIQATFPLAETAAAFATFGAGTRGKLVLVVG
jgi:NADPH:quinone reductase-like Zn-dependent oxidoreductase